MLAHRRVRRSVAIRLEPLEERRLLAVVFSDTFPSTTFSAANWSVTSGAAIDSQGLDEPSPTFSARLNTSPNPGDELRSQPIDLAGETSVKLRYYLELGGLGGTPDFSDELFAEYLNTSNTWVELDHQYGGFSTIQYELREAILPDDALHAGFQFRFRVNRGGGGSDADDYFVDDVSVETIPGEIRGTMWRDDNGNGQIDPGEPPLANRPMYLDLNASGSYEVGIDRLEMTDSNGDYLFDNLPAGTYTVAEVSQSGYTQTFPSTANPAQPPWIEIGSAPILAAQTYGNENTSGRTSSIAVDPSDPSGNTMYLGAANGGVWKTTNGGQSWVPLTDDQATLTTGWIAIAPSDSNVLYVGTGEAHFSGDSMYGRGVLKSVDGGATWTLLGQSVFDRRAISKVVVDPNNPDIVYVATTRAVNSPSNNMGVWKSVNGGLTWTQTTAGISTTASVTDLIIDPTNRNVLYCAIGEVRGAPTNGVYKSTNGGGSWSPIGVGTLPTGNAVGRTILAISSNGQSVYASFTGGSSNFGRIIGFYQSTNAGSTWANRTAGTPNYTGSQGWYDSCLVVDPNNSQIVYAGGGGGPDELIRSTNGGISWSFIGEGSDGVGPHVDHHVLTFDPQGRLLNGNDGGIWRTANAGTTWENLNTNLGITQFYGISIDPISPHIAYGGTQDNGTLKSVGTRAFRHIAGGDGGITAVDHTNPDTIFQEYQYFGSGWFQRSDDRGETYVSAHSGINTSDQGRFIIPYEMDASNSSHLVLGTNRVYETLNSGNSWNAISGKLTPTSNAVVAALEIAPSDPDVIYVSYTDGTVWVTTNGGTNWFQRQGGLPEPGEAFSGPNEGEQRGPEEVPPGVPGIVGVGDFSVDPLNPSIAYLVRDQFGLGKVFRTTNAGVTWTDITGNLPDLPVNSVQVDSRFGQSRIYVGTDAGVWRSVNFGASWVLFGEGLPNSLVQDLEIDTTRGVLAVGSHGRGIWETAIPLIDSDQAHTVFLTAGAIVENINFGNQLLDVESPGPSSVIIAGAGIHDPYTVPEGSGEQLRTVPVAQIDRITIGFGEPVVVTQGDLTIVGDSSGPIAIAGFSYDGSSQSGTWFLNTPIGADRVTITLIDDVVDLAGNPLDGEWDNPTSLADPSSDTFPAGDGTPGGDFVFRFISLPGDANRTNTVSGADYTIWADNFDGGAGPADKTFVDGDFDGNGHVTGADYTIWADNFDENLTLPPPEAPSSTTPEFAVAAPVLAAPVRVARQESTPRVESRASEDEALVELRGARPSRGSCSARSVRDEALAGFERFGEDWLA